MENRRRTFFTAPFALIGLTGIAILFLPALFAPLLANGRPLVALTEHGRVVFPFLRDFFAPESTERSIEMLFNWALLCLLPALGILAAFRRRPKIRKTMIFVLLFAAALPFLMTQNRLDKTNYRARTYSFVQFAPIPYGPAEIVGAPCEAPSVRHWLGTDDIGRSVASRMIYGARVSLSVGIFSTLLALAIGGYLGMTSGERGGLFDLFFMRSVEMMICLPTFLLLLILMAMLRGRDFEQSILVVIAVIGLTGWTGIAQLVRGETLKLRNMPFVLAAQCANVPERWILLRHILPNISGVILITFAFGVAGAILAESALSFLGFGVQPPTASWGGLLRQAFENPLDYFHLTLFPGLALFLAVVSFNFTGEALRKALAK
ncbi:MAG: ABC transporter permease [Victivallaceae bacterium]|nr:ABC transporter permease [Victivallaceae bacterium]